MISALLLTREGRFRHFPGWIVVLLAVIIPKRVSTQVVILVMKTAFPWTYDVRFQFLKPCLWIIVFMASVCEAVSIADALPVSITIFVRIPIKCQGA